MENYDLIIIGSLFCYDSSVFRRIRNDILFRHFYYNIHKTAWVELLEPDLHIKNPPSGYPRAKGS